MLASPDRGSQPESLDLKGDTPVSSLPDRADDAAPDIQPVANLGSTPEVKEGLELMRAFLRLGAEDRRRIVDHAHALLFERDHHIALTGGGADHSSEP